MRQKQWGVTHKGDTLEDGQEVLVSFIQKILTSIQVLGCGTDDVLTCHVIVLREPVLGVAAIGHFDEFSRKKNFDGLVASFLERVRQRKRASAWDYWEEDEKVTVKDECGEDTRQQRKRGKYGGGSLWVGDLNLKEEEGGNGERTDDRGRNPGARK